MQTIFNRVDVLKKEISAGIPKQNMLPIYNPLSYTCLTDGDTQRLCYHKLYFNLSKKFTF